MECIKKGRKRIKRGGKDQPRSFPLHRGRRLRRDVVDYAVDGTNLVCDAAGCGGEDVVRDARPVGGHKVVRRYREERDGVTVRSRIAQSNFAGSYFFVFSYFKRLIWFRYRDAAVILRVTDIYGFFRIVPTCAAAAVSRLIIHYDRQSCLYYSGNIVLFTVDICSV